MLLFVRGTVPLCLRKLARDSFPREEGEGAGNGKESKEASSWQKGGQVATGNCTDELACAEVGSPGQGGAVCAPTPVPALRPRAPHKSKLLLRQATQCLPVKLKRPDACGLLLPTSQAWTAALHVTVSIWLLRLAVVPESPRACGHLSPRKLELMAALHVTVSVWLPPLAVALKSPDAWHHLSQTPCAPTAALHMTVSNWLPRLASERRSLFSDPRPFSRAVIAALHVMASLSTLYLAMLLDKAGGIRNVPSSSHAVIAALNVKAS